MQAPDVPAGGQVHLPPPAVANPPAPVTAPAAAPSQDSPGLVEALKQRFAAEVAERELRHRAEMEALRKSAGSEMERRELQYRSEVQALQQSHAAAMAAREEQYAGALRVLQQSLDEVRGQLSDVQAVLQHESQARSAADAELQTRRAQLDMQYQALEGQAAEIASLRTHAAELGQALAAEQQTSGERAERVQKLEAQLRQVVSQSHQAALEAAGQAMDKHADAVQRGDYLAEEVALHGAAVNQMRTTIAQQRADREQLMAERQAARNRCVELENQLHALTLDARHLAEGLRRVEAEREAERQRHEVPEPEITQPPKLRLAGTGDTA